jgi:hypothetical protein
MPPAMPVLPVMAVELGVYGLTGGLLYHNRRLPLLVALIVSMAFGRIAAAMTAYGLSLMLGVKLQPFVYVTGALVVGLPGIIIQLLLIPLLIKRLQAVFPNFARRGERHEYQKIHA